MAVTSVRTCDRCNGTEDVQILTSVYGKKSWEVDLCQTCYTELCGQLAANSRRPTRSTIKPQHRFSKTEVSRSNL